MDQAERLLQRIRNEHLRPVPRWVVVARRLVRLVLFVAVFVLVSLSFASFFQELHAHRGRGWMFRQALAQAAPWIWAATALVSVVFAYVVFRELPRAWRLRPGVAIFAILLAGAGTGYALERGDVLLAIHRGIAHAVPAYRNTWKDRTLRLWHAPSEGRLAGTIESGSAFRDLDGKRWVLQGMDGQASPGMLRLLGEVCGDSVFCVRSWKPVPGEGRRGGGRNRPTE